MPKVANKPWAAQDHENFCLHHEALYKLHLRSRGLGLMCCTGSEIWLTIIRPRFQRLSAQRDSLVSCLDALSLKAVNIERP
jgi:hypothetical protein